MIETYKQALSCLNKVLRYQRQLKEADLQTLTQAIIVIGKFKNEIEAARENSLTDDRNVNDFDNRWDR